VTETSYRPGLGRLTGRVALVTGAGRGQGRSHAVALAREGADVVICDVNLGYKHAGYTINRPGDLAETARLVEQEDRRCLTFDANVRDFDAMQAMVDSAIGELGRLDVVVANAGIDSYAPVQEMSSEQWHDVVDTNLTGVFNTIRAAAPVMVTARTGSIVAISSAVGRIGSGNNAAYSAAKWGVIGLVKSAAIDLGPHFVRVNAVCPGYISTEMINNDLLPPLFFPHTEAPTNAMVDNVINERFHFIPVGRLPAEEVSNAVVFLASDESRFISGSTIDVSAGWSASWTA
jgi:SDR family mycofactocin-dependent oxidoreductase